MTAGERAPRCVGDLAAQDWRASLAGPGVGVRVGPFDLHLRTDVDSIVDPLQRLYRHHPLLDGERVYSCHADLRRVLHIGRKPGARVRFSVDGVTPHEDMPPAHALAVLEWGINLALAMRFHCFLMLHAAVVERNGRALLMPAWPGHGKTTLCAALIHRGWRLFSDEFGLLRPDGTALTPIPRPLPLKNESIGVLRGFAPDAELGPLIHGTRKGTVAHVKPPRESVERSEETAPAGWIVYPRWTSGSTLVLEEIGKAEGFMQLATNAFNYELLGEAAFAAARSLLDTSRCFRLIYSDLEQAVTALTSLADGDER